MRVSYPQRKRKKNFFRWLVFLMLLSGVGYAVYYFREPLFFRFERDKQGEILRRLASCVELIRQKAAGASLVSDIAQEKTLKEFNSLLDSLENLESLAGIVYFARGKLWFELFAIVPARNPTLYYDIFFLEFIERYTMSGELDIKTWQQAVLSLRKAMVFPLPEELKREAVLLLAELYLWGGRPFWTPAYELLRASNTDKSETIRHLFNILLTYDTPDFEKLKALFSPEPVTLWQAIYYLKAGNSPLAYSLLYQLTSATSQPQIRHNALYLLGKMQGKEKRYRQQLNYYRQIDPEEFLKRAPWFLSEFTTLLRFFGEVAEATRFIARYEKIILEQKPM